MMSQDSELKEAEKWASKMGFKWPTITFDDQETTILTKYAARSVPHYILIDKTGARQAEGLESVVKKLNAK